MAYDSLDYPLKSYLTTKSFLNLSARNGFYLTSWFSEEISSLLSSIQSIHSCGLHHGMLHALDSYGTCGGKIVIVNVQGGFLSLILGNDDDGIAKSEVSKLKCKDITCFKIMVEQNLCPNIGWPELNIFLECFHQGIKFGSDLLLSKLQCHPFLKKVGYRLEWVAGLEERVACGNHADFVKFYLSLNTDFEDFRGWDLKRDGWAIWLNEIFNYHDNYNGHPRQILRFLRAVFEHFDQHKIEDGQQRPKRLTLAVVEAEVMLRFPLFIDRIYAVTKVI